MSLLTELPDLSRWSLYFLLGAFGFITSVVLMAQIGCLRGKPFENPDGTKDDWREQKLFYGIAWADLLVACPLSFAGIALVFLAPRWGFFLMGMVSFWFVWANLVLTITSLRFESPKITPQWILVFPTGTVLGLALLAWIGVHFTVVYGV
jgi:hypothetical protein